MAEDAIVVRIGTRADAEAIRALVHAAYAKWIPVIGRLPMPMAADYAQAVERHRFDLLHVGAELAALIETVREADHVLVANVAVHPGFQGHGFGTRLMRLAEDLAAGAGLARLRLYTNKRYPENLRLYGRLGYRVEREEPYAGADRTREDDVMVHMAKDLTVQDPARR
jgi:GNAT superfamily N-acetyltransferase